MNLPTWPLDLVRILILIAASSLAAASPATAQCSPTLHSDCTSICGPGSDATTCRVKSCTRILPGSLIDCGERDLSIEGNNARILIEDGSFAIRAHSLFVGPLGSPVPTGRHILASRTAGSEEPFGFEIELTGDYYALGYLQADSATGGGSIAVDVAGNATLPNSTSAAVVSADGTGSGASGGEIVLRAGGDIEAGSLTADGSALGGTLGGRIRLDAMGQITMATGYARTTANGSASADEIGEGGTIQISAGGPLFVRHTLEAEGGGRDADGGSIHLEGDSVEVNDNPFSNHPRQLSVRGGVGAQGGRASGGEIRITAGPGGVQVGMEGFQGAVLDMTGGAGGAGQDGGALHIEADGDITLNSQVEILAQSRSNGGDGGSISLVAGGDLLIRDDTVLDARGRTVSSAEGVGASIELAGCAVTVEDGASLDASGYEAGPITIVAREGMLVGGQLNAGGTGPDGSTPIRLITRWAGVCSNNWGKKCAVDTDCPGASCLVINPTLQASASFTPAPPITLAEPGLSACS
jgi:hypothetical protein